MRERMIGVPVSITRYVSNDPPGFVASELIDAHGRLHHFIGKTVDVSADDIDANTSYPYPGVMACRIVDRRLDASGNELIVVDTTEPWSVESTDGMVQFEILRNNIVEFDLGSSVMVRWNGLTIAMAPESYRSLFAAFAGDVRYRRFVSQIARYARDSGRLRYWAADLWAQFLAAHPECTMDHEALCSILNRCSIHDCALMQKEVPFVSHHVDTDYGPSYTTLKPDLFPHHSPDVVNGRQPGMSNKVAVWYCEKCDTAFRYPIWR